MSRKGYNMATLKTCVSRVTTLMSESNSSSPRMASCRCRGVILFTRKSLLALPANSSTSAVRYSRMAALPQHNTSYSEWRMERWIELMNEWDWCGALGVQLCRIELRPDLIKDRKKRKSPFHIIPTIAIMPCKIRS